MEIYVSTVELIIRSVIKERNISNYRLRFNIRGVKGIFCLTASLLDFEFQVKNQGLQPSGVGRCVLFLGKAHHNGSLQTAANVN